MQSQLELKAKGIVQRLKNDRAVKRNEFFNKAMERYKFGATYPGRDENGRSVKTRPPKWLGIVFNQSSVIITLRPEDRRALQGQEIAVVAKLSKAKELPRKDQARENDMFAGVRLPHYIRESCLKDIDGTEGVVDAFNLINVKLGLERKLDEAEIKDAIFRLEAFKKNVLSRKRRAVKRILAMEKLEFTIAKLLEVPDSNNPVFTLSSACARFVAFLNRFGNWNAEQAAGIYVHNYHRECIVRFRRDEWLRWQLSALAKYPEQAFNQFSMGIKDPKLDGVKQPSFLLEELKKMQDKYLGPVIGELESAVKLFNSFKSEFAGKHFKDALRWLELAIRRAGTS